LLGSFRIGTVFGIALRVHWLVPAMLAFFVLVGRVPFQAVFFVGVIASCVIVLHELGHSLVAKSFGIKVVDITLWPLGGMARMTEIPENARIEGLIAVAGPAVNFALAALASPFLLGLDSLSWEGLRAAGFMIQIATYFMIWNLLLGAFNLIPAFPLDGGRILRAMLAARGDWVAATETAVRVGRWFAIAMVLAGLIWPGQVGIMPLIGIFVWFSGARELFAVRLRHGINPLARAMGLDPDALRGAWPRPAAEAGRPSPTKSPGQTGAHRPEFDRSSGPAGSSRRISDEDIERLERYHGRLPR